MPSYNKAILIGHLGRDPEIRYMPNGDAVANFSLATTDTWKNKDGVKQEKTVWHRCSAFGKLAEIFEKYVKKGDPVLVEGSITSDEYTDKDGVKKTSYGIRVNVMQMLGGSGERNAKPESSAPSATVPQSSGFEDMDDDIPF